jgi:YD repeat-containing protein
MPAHLIIKTTLVAITIAAIGAVQAQQRVTYGPDGRVIARTVTDTQNTTVVYGADGKVVARETGADLRRPHVCPVPPCRNIRP